MLRKNRLKKELANLLILKNKIKKKIIGILILFLIGGGIFQIAECNGLLPEEKFLASGDSAVENYMDKIDNYRNVMTYSYENQNQRKNEKKITLLKNTSFAFLEVVDVPGMPNTVITTVDKEQSPAEEQYPQGICLTDDFVLVTSYAGKKSEPGTCMVYDRVTGKLLVTLGMDENSHLGGITFDGEYIWVCNSFQMAIERIPYEVVRRIAAQNTGQFVNVINLMEQYTVLNVPSGVTFYDGRLYVVTHSKVTNSVMVSYVYGESEDELYVESIYRIPPKVQGMAVDEEGCVYLSTSYGRMNSSYLKKYDSITAMSEHVNDCVEEIEMPPCSEGIAFYGKRMFVLFESAAKKYLEGTDGNGRSTAPLDKILVIDLT